MLAKCLLSGANVREVKIFYSYAHRDANYRSMIDDVLGRFKWDVTVRAWYDKDIRPGAEWAEQIHYHLDTADILVLFITQGFVESQYCMDVELPRAMLRHDRNEACVIPILLEPTNPDWRTLPLSKLQALPFNGVPLSHWKDTNQAVRDIIQGIVNLIAEPFLEPTDRTLWKLYLDTDVVSFSLKDEAEVIASLREISGDTTLRSRGIAAAGSTVLDMDSTRNGFLRVRHWFETNDRTARKWFPFEVMRIIEWYGAGVHAGAKTGALSPPSSPTADRLQFPSAPGCGIKIKALKTNIQNPLHFNFTFDTGDWKGSQESFASESQLMIKDFLALIATPEEDLWVNLSPNDSAKLLGKTLQGTHVGKMLLEYDLLLKRLASTLLHPDSECGVVFWDRVFEVIKRETGTTDHLYRTYPRLWIVPTKAVVYKRKGPCEKEFESEILAPLLPGECQAVVVDQAVEIKCEQDYFEAKKGQFDHHTRTDQICHEAFVDLVLPIVQKEVSTGKAFAGFRQIYNSMILSTWTKTEFKENPAFLKYIDSGNTSQLEPTITDIARIGGPRADRTFHGAGLSDVPKAHGPAGSRETDEMEPSFDEAARLRESGNLIRSKELLERVVEERLRAKGENHYLTHVAISQLGRTLRALKEFDRAEELHRKVLVLCQRLLGPNHEYTINSMRILADTLSASGQIVEAAQILADAAAAEVTLKPEHQDPDNREFYDRYLEIYRNGVFHIERHEFEPSTGQRITRSYFSGAVDFRRICEAIRIIFRSEEF